MIASIKGIKYKYYEECEVSLSVTVLRFLLREFTEATQLSSGQ